MTTPLDPFGDEGGPFMQPEASDRDQLSGCDFFHSLSSELALGSLTGSDRSAALAHLESCEACQAALKELSVAADALLLLAPEADPPAGFEVRLLARLGHDGSSSALPTAVQMPAPVPAPVPAPAAGRGSIVPLRLRARAALAAAAVVIAGAGIGLGVAVAPRQAQPAATGQIRLATLRSSSAYSGPTVNVGEVAITGGSPSWVVMTVQRPGWSGRVYCVVDEGGRSRQVGSFWLHDGTGSWAVQLSSPGASVTSAQVQEGGGAVLATADFTS
jgi:hypothetical protein